MDTALTISGVGVLWAGGSGLGSLAPFVRAPRSHRAELRRIRAEDGRALYGVELPDAAIEALAPARANRGADRFGRLNVAGVKATALAAGFDEAAIRAGCLADVGLVLSTTFGPWDSINRFVLELISEGPTGTSARTFANTVPNSAQGRVAIELGLKGHSTTLAGVPALSHAFDLYERGHTQHFIAGGADELSANVLTALSEDGTLAPQAPSAEPGLPFDRSSSGATAGEAYAGFFCESEASAKQRGVRPLAHILGYGIASDGRLADSFAQADPEGRCFVRAMQQALERARVSRDQVDAIIAAANGCAGLDQGEAQAIRQVFDSERLVLAPKSATGECFGAASALGVAAGVALLADGDVRTLLVNSVDIGGNCTSMVLARI